MDRRWASRFKLAVVMGCALLGGAGLTGCESNKQSDYDLLVAENNQLRDRLASLEGNTDQAEAMRQQYESVRSRLEAENRELAQALEEMRARGAAGAPGSMVSIDGTTVSTRGSDLVVTVAGDVLFASGSADLKPDARATLNRVASTIQSNYSNNIIRVEGYTDGDPIRRSNWESNEWLSAARALAVEKYLVSRGINANRIYSAAFGPSNPKSTKAASRRVEIVVLGGG